MEHIEALIALIAGIGLGWSSRSLWALRLRRGHLHIYDHMTSDGKWRCRFCEAPKKEGR